MFADFAIKLFGTIDDFFVKQSIFPAFFERERLFRYRLIILRKSFFTVYSNNFIENSIYDFLKVA